MSHNSWTFLKPRTFFGKLFSFIARCQSKNIQEQYEKYNVRMFDLRIKLKDNKPIIAHGIFEYSIEDLEKDLAYLNTKDVYIRVLLEVRNSFKDTDKQRAWFINYCKQLEEMYQNIKFCGGNPTYTAIQYFKFKNSIPSIEGNYASSNKNIVDDLWPWLYAKRHNKDIENTDKEFIALDFVEI